MTPLSITLIIIAIVFLINYRNILSLLNSHFGTNLTTKESDTTQKQKNYISCLYDDQIAHDYENSPFKTPLNSAQVPSIHIDNLTKDKFIILTNNFTTPLVVKEFLKNTKAVKEWNLDFFATNYGSTSLPVIDNGDITHHKKYIDGTNRTKMHYVTLGQFINSLKRGEKMYINNVSRIFGLHPELLEYLELENIKKYTGEDIKDDIHITNLFFGGKGTGTSLHCSITGNFFYNIKGKKRWYLIDPKHTKYLKPIMSRTGLFAVSQLDICTAKKHSYPLNVPRLETCLEEGDMLFNPPWWWHAITNESEYTIACANRFTNFWSGFSNNPLFTMIFFSHPIANYNDFGRFKTREESNMEFDKALLGDITKNREGRIL